MQGKGIGGALIAAAEERVVQHSTSIQIEYEFDPDKEHSMKLEAMYSKRGFKQAMSFPNGGVEFRIMHRTVSAEERKSGVARRLSSESKEIAAILSQLPAAPAEEQPPAQRLQSKCLFEAMAAFVEKKGVEKLPELPEGALAGNVRQVYQFVVVDVVPQFRCVLDLKTASGSAWEGQDPNPGITISMTDEKMVAWYNKSLDWKDAFWRGAVTCVSPIVPRGGPGMWWSDSV